MACQIDEQLIEAAFHENLNLKKRVFDAINNTPQHAALFGEIAKHTESIRHKTMSNGAGQANGEPSSKKRKIDGDSATNGSQSFAELAEDRNSTVIFEVKDLSFQVPLRKKMNLEITRNGRPTTKKQLQECTIRARAPNTNTIEYEGANFEYMLRLPVPEKAQKADQFILIPATGDKISSDAGSSEPLLFTMNHGGNLQVECHDSEMKEAIAQGDGALEAALKYATGGNVKMTSPDAAEFVSATPEAHRKGENAYHVKAFKGSKDGYLFFLGNGVFFGFKKPLQFFPLNDITSISYTSVLQRTFNLNIGYSTTYPVAEEKEVEFSMIDQAQFTGIDAYIKRHQLQDASMAEARKAKRHDINAKKGAEAENAIGEEEPGELQKAAEQIQDEEDDEDELEEDYDPGSEGESEGSGASSEDDNDDGDEDVNLVEDELGSEAENVDTGPDDDDQL